MFVAPEMVRKPSKVAVGLYFANVGLAQLCVMKNLDLQWNERGAPSCSGHSMMAIHLGSCSPNETTFKKTCHLQIVLCPPSRCSLDAFETHHDNTNSDVLSCWLFKMNQAERSLGPMVRGKIRKMTAASRELLMNAKPMPHAKTFSFSSFLPSDGGKPNACQWNLSEVFRNLTWEPSGTLSESMTWFP